MRVRMRVRVQVRVQVRAQVRVRARVRMRTASSFSPAHRCCCVSCATASSSSVTRSTTGVAAGTPRPSVAIANAASPVVCNRIVAFTACPT